MIVMMTVIEIQYKYVDKISNTDETLTCEYDKMFTTSYNIN